MALTKKAIIDLCRRRSRHYDMTANLYYLIGFREQAFRKKAVKALDLCPGDTVIEIGCGKGLNFSLLQDAVGPQGKIIGVDLNDSMLDQARGRVRRESPGRMSNWFRAMRHHTDFPKGLTASFQPSR